MCNKLAVYNEVKNFVESNNCGLVTSLEDFINKKKVIIIKCGNCAVGIIKTRFSDFKTRKYKVCKDCKSLFTRNEIFNELKIFIEIESNSGCILLSTLDEYKNNTSKIMVKCPCGNIFPTTNSMFVHANKRQCNDCGFKNKGQSRVITYEVAKKYIEQQNFKLITPKEEYINGTQPIEIGCACGENSFTNTYALFKYGKGIKCDECNRKDSAERHLIPYSEIKYFIEVESESGCKLITPENQYINTRLKVEFECKCGESFFTSVHEFKSDNKQQCNKCGINLMSVKDFVKIFEIPEEVNSCKLIEYENKDGYIYARSIVKLQCSCDEVFETKRSHFGRGKNKCDKCSSFMSKGEEEIRKHLVKFNIKYIREYTFEDCRGIRKPLPFDFAIFNSDGNLTSLIEFDGKQHFEPVNFGGCSDESALAEYLNRKNNDSIKNLYCESNNIPLLRIPYWNFDRIEEILNTELQSLM